jgi:hypothetical protein
MNNKKISVICLHIAGVICLFYAVSHSLFERMFNWESTLSCLSQFDRAIMLTYHYLIIMTIGFMSFVSVFQAKLILESRIGKSVLVMFSVFYIIRIITELTLFGFSGKQSIVLIVICIIPVFTKQNL